MEFLKEWIIWAYMWVTEAVARLGRFLLDLIFEVLPFSEDLVGPETAFAGYYTMCNLYLPITEVLLIFVAIGLFSVSVIVFRYVLKFIPMIG